MIKYSKKGKVMQMKSREGKVVDYVAKGGTANGSSTLKHILLWGITAAYAAYTCYSMTAISPEKMAKENYYGFLFLFFIFMAGIPISAMFLIFRGYSIAEDIKATREFFDESGQEATNKNINILLDRYYKGEWQRIEDMLYETRRVPLAENMELISGNVNQNLKEALPAKQD